MLLVDAQLVWNSVGELIDANELQSRQLALLSRDFGSLTKGSHEQLHKGDIVQVLVADEFEHRRFLTSSITTNGSPRFFVIGGLLECESGTSWAVVKQCTLRTPSTLTQLPDFNQPLLVEVEKDNFYSTSSKCECYNLELD